MGSNWNYVLGFLFPNQYTKARDKIIDGFWAWVIPPLLVCLAGLAIWLMFATKH
jgi:hypothetical protein